MDISRDLRQIRAERLAATRPVRRSGRYGLHDWAEQAQRAGAARDLRRFRAEWRVARAKAANALIQARLDRLDALLDPAGPAGDVPGPAPANSLAVADFFVRALTASVYPDEFPHRFRVAYQPATGHLVIEFHLPPPEVIPAVRLHRYDPVRDDPIATPRDGAEIRRRYTEVIARVTLRTLTEIVAADRYRLVRVISFNGVLETVDGALAEPVDRCLVSLTTFPGTVDAIDGQEADPVAELDRLGAVVSAAPEGRVAVAGFDFAGAARGNPARVVDVLAGLEDRPDLLGVDDAEFAGIIAGLLAGLGLQPGKDTRDLRSWRWTAVDALPAPDREVTVLAMRGGPADAGTVNGLDGPRGMIISVDGFLPGAYEAANGRDLELIDGPALIVLLAEVSGLKARIRAGRAPAGVKGVPSSGGLSYGVPAWMRADLERPSRTLLDEVMTGEEDPERFLVGQMPAQVRDGADVSLIVRITRQRPGGPGARAAAMHPWPIPDSGSDVTVVVHAPAGLIPLGPEQQVLRVHPGADPDPVRFPFRAAGVDVRAVQVTAWAGGSFLAELAFEVSVTDRGPSLEPVTRVATLDDTVPDEGAVTLQIRRSADRYTFQLHNSRTLYEPIVVSVAADPSGVMTKALETLRQFARDGRQPGYTPPVAREWLRNMGVTLWRSLVPEAVREQYLSLHGSIRTFAVATGDDIPWELLYPMTKGHDEGFLVQQFPVTRTVYNAGRSRTLSLGDARFVHGARPPQNAAAEFAAINRLVSAGSEPVLITDVGQLLELFATGRTGLTHFACHADNRDDGPAIAMTGGQFTPVMMETTTARELLTANRPLVFINACRSAGAVPHFTRMMGWGEQFLLAGAGAFVGTLWDVRSSTAQTFAEAFYADLVAGRTLGDAALGARRAVRDDMDPTWLAYTVYGDPHALAHRGESSL